MRAETSLSILAIIMAFLSGILALSVKNKGTLEISRSDLHHELETFENSKNPYLKLNTIALAEFIDPKNQLPFYHQLRYEDALLLKKMEDCGGLSKTFRDEELKKALHWQEYLCGRRELGDAFFETPPYFHPSGKSYAYLFGMKTGFKKNLLKYLHVLELKESGLRDLPDQYHYLVGLEWKELHRLSEADKILIAKDHVFIREDHLSEAYRVYAKQSWDSYWKKSLYTPAPLDPQKVCYFKEHSICWNYDVAKSLFGRWNKFTFLMLLTTTLTFILLWLLVVRVRQRQADEKRLKFALEMLAHEIRTPVTNLALHLENFRSDFDQQTPQNQAGLLRLFDQVERLRRVVTTSENYLRKDLGRDVLQINTTEVSSLRSFIEYALDPFMDQIDLVFKGEDCRIRLDPYWTSICIKNIVENALRHGRAPVSVEISVTDSRWTLMVQDQGMEKFSEDKKDPNGKGLGLGMKLVRQILTHLGGSLKTEFGPTRITLQFERKV